MPATSGVFVQNKDWALLGAMSVTSSSAYTFTIPSSTVAQAAVYSHNSQQYMVTAGVSPGTSLVCGGTGAPLSSGTLTLVSGTGPSTLTFSSVASSVPVFGTGGINNVWWRRSGGNIELRWEYVHSVAGTNGTGQYMFFLASNLFSGSFDNTVLSPQVIFANSGISYPRNAVGSFTAEMNTSTSVLAGSVSIFGNFMTMAGSAGSSSAGTPSVVGSAYIGFGAGATMAIAATMVIPVVSWSAYN